MFFTKLLKPMVAACGCLLFSQLSLCQDAHSSAINSTGGSFSNDKMVIEWSVGELVRIDTRNSENKSLLLTQGLLQPDFGRQLILVTDPSFAAGEIKILPNPVRSLLQVQISGRQAGYMRCMLYDEKGVRLTQSGFQYYGYGYTQTINMTKLAGGNYFLYVELEPVTGSQVRKGSYKIVKLN
ncbi:hypothetical protein [Flavihumibacter sp. UBA7668]|uniref:hypothetical protein n=1 Tax=Flavihumibacter sp. UBA7668 TaxID=1946542 RepID=UPI0025BFABC1|nr:hypothetical protein [Flavihumibacter sp. UBA7668]